MCESPRGSSTRKSRVAEQIIQKQVQTQMLAKFGEGSKEALEACLGLKKENFSKREKNSKKGKISPVEVASPPIIIVE